jgi:hypothetical protein
VIDGETLAACFYEYGRESTILREAAATLQKLRRQKNRSVGQLYAKAAQISNQHSCGPWFLQARWRSIWLCQAFPGKPWNQLTKQQRAEVLRLFPVSQVQPLDIMHEVTELNAAGVFDELKAMGTDAEADLVEEQSATKKRAKLLPIVEAGWPAVSKLMRKLKRLELLREENKNRPKVEAFKSRLVAGIKAQEAFNESVHAVFTLNFSKSKKWMIQAFEAWLDLPENQDRFRRHRKENRGTTGTEKERLFDLALWRLHDELGYEEMIRFAGQNRKRFEDTKSALKANYKKGDFRPFLNAHKGGDLPNKVPACGGEPSYARAKRRAREYLSEIIPHEFGASMRVGLKS